WRARSPVRKIRVQPAPPAKLSADRRPSAQSPRATYGLVTISSPTSPGGVARPCSSISARRLPGSGYPIGMRGSSPRLEPSANAAAGEQRGDDIAHTDDRAERGQGQEPVFGVDVRGVDGLGHALQEVALAVDDALRPAGASGCEQHARRFVQAELSGSPALPR